MNNLSNYEDISAPSHDKVSKTLIIVLILALIVCFAGMIYSTVITYEKSSPIPEQFVNQSGKVVMTKHNIVAGKNGFQKADMMDYGSIYGMGSYFGEDYTAQYLVQLGKTISNQMSLEQYSKPYASLTTSQRDGVTEKMQHALKNINLTEPTVVLPNSVANAVSLVRQNIITKLQENNNKTGWTKAYSLSNSQAKTTGDFLIYSSFTTIARRPGKNYSWTNNWPYEPSVGNSPTTHTFIWTWVSITILLFFIGLTLAIFRIFIDKDDPKLQIIHAPLQTFFSLTASQKATGKFFILVALLFLIQIASGSILAHYYTDRSSFYGINLIPFLPFAFLRTLHLLTPILWIGLSWIGASLFLAPFIGGGVTNPKAKNTLLIFSSMSPCLLSLAQLLEII